MCFAPQRRALFRHRNFQKWSEPLGVLYILTWKCASRHNGVHFFDIATSKSGPSMVCFVHFDLEMCFAPQRRALFQHLNFQSGPKLRCFVHFDLEMCFAPQRRFTFLTSQLPKVVRDRQFLTLLTSKCASRHNGVQFFNRSCGQLGSAPAALASLLSTHRSHKSLEETQCFATFLPFRASVSSVFLLFLFWSSLF